MGNSFVLKHSFGVGVFYDEENIENIVDFAAYVNEQEFDEEQELDYSWLTNLIYEYEYGKDC